jgi:hypothetical protein
LRQCTSRAKNTQSEIVDGDPDAALTEAHEDFVVLARHVHKDAFRQFEFEQFSRQPRVCENNGNVLLHFERSLELRARDVDRNRDGWNAGVEPSLDGGTRTRKATVSI